MEKEEVDGKKEAGRSIKEWTGMDFPSSAGAAENRTRCKWVVAKSSIVFQRPRKVME